ncbi:MAG: M15 family metallopeptidase [Bacilli bacterium]|nr:M15 family metallopeptidase [Bacilli bacterium]
MKKVKRIKARRWLVILGEVIGLILCLCLGVFLFYQKQISDLTKLGYSKIASEKILFSKHKDYIMKLGENKTVNKAFESEDYIEDNLDNYSKIKYFDQKDLISNINKLLEIGYSNSDINIILSHGTNESVTEFTKHERVHYLEEYFEYDYAKIENYDRYVNYSDQFGSSEEDTIIYINLNIDKEDYVDPFIVEEFSIDMLVNRHRSLKEDYVPSDLVTVDSKYASSNDCQSSRIAYNAFIEMYNKAESEGYQLVINSAYRSYQDQLDIIDTYRNAYGQSYVDKYVARAGFSEHQTGLAFDIGSRNSNIFADSKEYEWMLQNAHLFGFVLRYDKRYEDITQFRYEPWHYRYVGKEIAKYLYEHNNMSLEEYYVLFLDR